MYKSINSNEDVQYFLEKTNSLHDGYIIEVHYENNGISSIKSGDDFSPKQTKLVIKILVSSIWNTVVELEFENIKEWQIKDKQWDMTDTSVIFNDNNWIIWSDDVYMNIEEIKKGSYVIARSMRWRIIE